MGSKDDFFQADGMNEANFTALGGGDGSMAFFVPLGEPYYQVGGGFEGWYAGLVGYGGSLGPNGEPGPAYNDYTDYLGVLGKGYYVPGVAGTSTTHVGVYGQTEEDPDSAIPQIFQAGVFGAANTGPGVVGWSTTWNAIEGWAYQGTAILGVSEYERGVHGASTWQPGVQGWSENDVGVMGGSGPEDTQGPPLPNQPSIAGVVGTSDQHHGVIGTSNLGAGVLGFSNDVGVLGWTTNPQGHAGVFRGNVAIGGTLTAAVKNAVVPFPDGSKRLLHCMESPEHWFEDFGEAKLKNGSAVVKIDGNFARVIKSRDYHVFVTPEGDCHGLYVRRKSADSFEVRELTGGKSDIAFSYRIVGRRKDIKSHQRFASIDTPLPEPVKSARALRKVAPTAAGRRAFAARLEQKARERAPKGAEQGRALMRSKGPRPDFERLMRAKGIKKGQTGRQ